MDTDELDRCRDCYAYVDSTTRHKRWHRDLEDKLGALEARIRRAEQR